MSILEKKIKLVKLFEDDNIDKVFKICDQQEAQQLFVEIMSYDCSLDLLELGFKYIKDLNYGNDWKLGKDVNPLLWACSNKKNNYIEWLVSNGADVNRLSSNNTNSIMFSIQRGDYKAFKFLLENDALVEINDKSIYNYIMKDTVKGFFQELIKDILDSKKKNNLLYPDILK